MGGFLGCGCVEKGRSPSGCYSTKQFCNPYSHGLEVDPLWKEVWCGLAPPKVQTFCWLIMKERLGVSTELAKRNIIDVSDIICCLCEKEEETIGPLFFHYRASWPSGWWNGKYNGFPFMTQGRLCSCGWG